MKHWYDKQFKGVVCEPDCTEEWLELIWAIGFDYDGCHSEESLKGLIDELIEMVQKARRCLYDGKVFVNEEEDLKSWEEAKAERERCENGEVIRSE
jgi:phosphoribosylaminoimidazole carboxylase (NCAIR synthetase)